MDAERGGIQHVADTAYWMASYRAAESERGDALFRDPLAKVLVGERGAAIVKSMQSIGRFAYWGLVMRTCLIDEWLQASVAQGYHTIINLGAGLDTRPYRLSFAAPVHWIELDYPQVIAMKDDKLRGETPRCRLERIACDLSDRGQRRQLFAELDSRIGPAVVLTEGVIPYLDEPVVRELAGDLHGPENFRRWISEYYSPAVYPRYRSPQFQQLLNDAPFRFFPDDWFSVFASGGWQRSEMRYLVDEGLRRGRRFPVPWWANLLRLFVGQEKFLEKIRLTAYVVFEKTGASAIASNQ